MIKNGETEIKSIYRNTIRGSNKKYARGKTELGINSSTKLAYKIKGGKLI